MKILLIVLPILIMSFTGLHSQNIALAKPDKEGGMPLMKALDERSSHREFSTKEITQQQLSNLCWAAWGINRPESGKRTAPSSMNKQEMELYVVLPHAAYLYNAEEHQLDLIKEGDLRRYCGEQDFVATAPLNFIYVANLQKIDITDAASLSAEELLASHANTGFMAQNVYLTCASEGLECVVRAWIDKDALEEALGLSPLHKVILGQTIGYKL